MRTEILLVGSRNAFVARGVAVEFGQPPLLSVGRRRAVLAALVSMPEAAVDEDGGFVFGQENVRTDEGRARRSARAVSLTPKTRRARSVPPYLKRDSPVQAKAVAEPVQEGADDAFRRGVLAADA